MATHTAPPKQFVTDEQLANRLEHVENGLRHLEYWVPSLLREVAEIRQLLAGSEQGRSGYSDAAKRPVAPTHGTVGCALIS